MNEAILYDLPSEISNELIKISKANQINIRYVRHFYLMTGEIEETKRVIDAISHVIGCGTISVEAIESVYQRYIMGERSKESQHALEKLL
ncbi:hypothetical protein [Paenibacillus sp. BAC0078]